ncbi:ATP-binding protein [Arthrobacter sp. zg-ZUI122]|nr:ATP-binding protein [Arthrobacter sunyaminii]
MLKTTAVFTPNTSSPKLSKVARTVLDKTLSDCLDEGGMYVFVQGVTKLGKTTLVASAVRQDAESLEETGVDQHFWFDSQNLRGGAPALWAALASQLRQPFEEALATTKTDTSKWSFLGSLGFFSSSAGGEHSYAYDKSRVIAVDLPHAIPAALKQIVDSGKSVAIVLDDFHFIGDEATRMEILQALKPVADKGVTIIVVTLPYRDNFTAFQKSNIGGRNQVLEIPTWTVPELSEIARTGFKELNLSAEEEDIRLLAENSFGSPQIMQSLCLLVCRTINGYRFGPEQLTELKFPENPEEIFTKLSDQNARLWLRHLGTGAATRGVTRAKHPIVDGDRSLDLDGYKLVLHALRNLGPQAQTPLVDLKAEIARLRSVNLSVVSKMNLHQVLTPMTVLALADTEAKLKEMDDSKEQVEPGDVFQDADVAQVPQPVFEWNPKAPQSPISILDPLLLYALKWHWPEVLDALMDEQRKVSTGS